MSLVAIWVDHQQANVFKFTSNGIKREAFHGHFPEHHTHASDNRENQVHEDQMFKELIPQLSDAKEILILGPGVTKIHFKNFIEKRSTILGKKIVGCETTDHPTEPQLLSLASRFFNSEHLK